MSSGDSCEEVRFVNCSRRSAWCDACMWRYVAVESRVCGVVRIDDGDEGGGGKYHFCRGLFPLNVKSLRRLLRLLGLLFLWC